MKEVGPGSATQRWDAESLWELGQRGGWTVASSCG